MLWGGTKKESPRETFLEEKEEKEEKEEENNEQNR